MAERHQTLMTCTACEGAGRVMQELPNGRYRSLSCRFCGGGGMMSRAQELAYRHHLEVERRGRARTGSGDDPDPGDRPSSIFADAVVHPATRRPPR